MRKFAGLALLVVVVGIVAFVVVRGGGGRNTTAAPGTTRGDVVTLKGLIGGEKTSFLKDPEVVKILRDRYKLEVVSDRRGSLEMVREEPPADRDFLWPSSQVALEIYKNTKRPLARSEILFNSPIVLYSWGPVTDVLAKAGVVQAVNNAYYVVDFPKLVRMIDANRQWKDLGLTQLYGQVQVYSTDPTLSNSGNMFAGLLANVLNSGQVVTDATLPKVLPTVKMFFENQGYMEQSSDVIFRQFLNKGMGDKPIIVGYEAQMIGYSLENDPRFASRQKEVRMLYPRPTVWSSHPLIALTPRAAPLIDALQDKEIQRLAWEKHGFRSAVGAPNDVKALKIQGIPQTIENIIPMPASRVMDGILRGLANEQATPP